MALKALKNTLKKRLTASDVGPSDEDCPELTLVININDVHTQIMQDIGEGSHSIVYEGSWESHNGLVSS